ncbi:MAG TPA: iron-sulfur cluster assembly accessory protein [Methylocystis sp.]|nr:iron-sulfur cluster assembly accessory protein [Methylocystis sp.]
MHETANEFDVSEAAAKRIVAILSDAAPGSAFRIGVDGGGCSGFKYVFSVDEPRRSDLLIERGTARVIVDDESLSFLRGARLDFIDDLMGEAFKIENPNAASSCGCGVSFSV